MGWNRGGGGTGSKRNLSRLTEKGNDRKGVEHKALKNKQHLCKEPGEPFRYEQDCLPLEYPGKGNRKFSREGSERLKINSPAKRRKNSYIQRGKSDVDHPRGSKRLASHASAHRKLDEEGQGLPGQVYRSQG